MTVGIPGISRWREWQIERRPADRKFVRCQLADNDRSGRSQSRDRRGIVLGDPVKPQPRVASRRHSRDIDYILDRDWHTEERSARQIGALRGLARIVGAKMHKRSEARLEHFDPPQQGIN